MYSIIWIHIKNKSEIGGRTLIAPCKNCENKGCGIYHDKCEKYQQYKKEYKAMNSNINKQKEIQVKLNEMHNTRVKNYSKIIHKMVDKQK